MNKTIYEVLEMLDSHGYESYVIGGYVRDLLLKRNESCDVDITTSAKPKEVVDLFSNYDVKLYEYGNVSFTLDKYSFDITTFRKELKYVGNRKPEKIVYIDSLEEDLKRRDFTINTICLDKDNNIVDYYDGRKDIKRKMIRAVGDPHVKLKEDALRILRAVRFATIYKYRLDDDLKAAIMDNKDLLKNISYERKKEELNKIFCSRYKKYGIKLLKQLKLLEPLELKNIDNVLLTNDLTGMWSTITDVDYAFTKKEKTIINKINLLLKENNINDKFVQYKYGMFPLNIVSDLLKLNTKKIISNYDKLPIKDKIEIKIQANEICEVLNKEPGDFIKEVFAELEKEILLGNLENDNRKLKEYVKNNF